tara:strand:+ start:4019 stop:5293 length:1275 start_codon:yes stop_codon:yes gene_type:complete
MKLNDYNGVILKLHKEGLKFTSIADKLIKMYELDESEHRNLRRHASKVVKDSATADESYQWNESDSTASVRYTTSNKIETLDDAIAFSRVDTDTWEVERWTFNKWETTIEGVRTPLIQVKVWFKKIKEDDASVNDIRKEIIEDIKKHAPKYEYINYNFKTKERNLLELNLFDVHFGKLAWHEESSDNYDLKIATQRVYDAVDGLLDKARGYDFERIVLPTGNDLFNADKDYPFSSTTAGTPQHEDARWQRTFRTVRQVMCEVIEKLQLIAPVDVPIIPGNHDKTKCFFLGDSLEGWFHNNPQVYVDNSPKVRKYYKYGDNLIGYTHGDKEKIIDLPLIMAQEVPEMWANTIHREFHLGHYHQKKDMKWLSTQEYKGVVIRLLRSLSGTDAWHYEKGYVGGSRSAEAFIWNNRGGVVANLIHTIV